MAVILLDVDGALYVSGKVIPGGADAALSLREEGQRLRSAAFRAEALDRLEIVSDVALSWLADFPAWFVRFA